MRINKQIFAAVVMAAVMSTGLSADIGKMGGNATGTCIFIEGLMMKAMPVWVGELLLLKFGCE
jgi:hypothetical protein